MINSYFPPYDNHKDDQFNGPMPIPIRIERVVVQEDWFQCGTSYGNVVVAGVIFPQLKVWTATMDSPNPPLFLADTLGIIGREELHAEKDIPTGNWFIPKGKIAIVYRHRDSPDGHYEPICFGNPCPEGSSSSSGGSESGSSHSGSESRSMMSVSSSGSHSSGSGSSSSSGVCDPCTLPNGHKAGWMTFNDCDGNSHYYWGS